MDFTPLSSERVLITFLKGTWQGWTTFGSVQSNPVLTWLVIKNDTVPVQRNITLNNLLDAAALIFPADAKTAGGVRNGSIAE
jgi:hypothetical protein